MMFGTVIWTLTGAIFGAIFGYLLGLIIGLLPGMGGAGLPALLAAIGFIGGAVLGILASLAIIIAWRGVYMRKIHDSAHEFGHSFKRYNRYHSRWARVDHYWWDGCAGENKLYSAEDALQEMDGYLSYLEDLPEESLASSGDKLGRLSERLDRLRASLHH